jgi:hypothetical protein
MSHLNTATTLPSIEGIPQGGPNLNPLPSVTCKYENISTRCGLHFSKPALFAGELDWLVSHRDSRLYV